MTLGRAILLTLGETVVFIVALIVVLVLLGGFFGSVGVPANEAYFWFLILIPVFGVRVWYRTREKR